MCFQCETNSLLSTKNIPFQQVGIPSLKHQHELSSPPRPWLLTRPQPATQSTIVQELKHDHPIKPGPSHPCYHLTNSMECDIATPHIPVMKRCVDNVMPLGFMLPPTADSLPYETKVTFLALRGPIHVAISAISSALVLSCMAVAFPNAQLGSAC